MADKINKTRSRRATHEQYERMLDFLTRNKHLADGKFRKSHRKGRIASEKWEQLTTILNRMHGAQKTSIQWQVAWRDLKSRATMKSKKRSKQSTGRGKGYKISLNDLDVRVLNILGFASTEASSNYAQSEGDTNDVKCELQEHDPFFDTDIEVKLPQQQFDDTVEIESTSSTNANSLQPKMNVFESTSEQFLLIAKQQANSMAMHAKSAEVQAAAAKLQAEAAKEQAQATLMQARALNRVAVAFEQLADSMRPIVKIAAANMNTVEDDISEL